MGRNDFRELTVEYLGRWDQDWLEQRPEVHSSLWGVRDAEVGGVGDGQELDWSKTMEDLSQDHIHQISNDLLIVLERTLRSGSSGKAGKGARLVNPTAKGLTIISN